jgi:hypothetical protein
MQKDDGWKRDIASLAIEDFSTLNGGGVETNIS